MTRSRIVSALVVMAAAIVLSVGSAANGTVLFYEGFEYAAGQLNGQVHPDGDTWAGLDYYEVQEGSLTYPGLKHSGNTIDNVGDSHGTRGGVTLENVAGINTMWSTAGTYYMTYLSSGRNVVIQSPGSNGQGAIMDFSPSGATLWGGFVSSNHFTPDPTFWDPWWFTQNVADPGTDGGVHLWAFRVENNGAGNDDRIDLVIDPDLSLGEPNWNSPTLSYPGLDITTDLPNTLTINGANLSGGDYANQGGLDEIRIATSWPQAIPEPASLALLSLGGLAMLRRRRYR